MSNITITSRQIADATEFSHADVSQDIRSLLKSLDLDEDEFINGKGDFSIPEDIVLALAKEYDAFARQILMAKWEEVKKENKEGYKEKNQLQLLILNSRKSSNIAMNSSEIAEYLNISHDATKHTIDNIIANNR